MKFLIHLAVTFGVCLVLQFFLPWWTLAIGAFAAGYYFGNNGYTSFLAGFLGVGLLWLTAAYYIDSASQHILTEKINRLLPVNVFLLTVLTGGLTGGFSSLTGSLLKSKK